MRSKYETKIANYLKSLGVSFQYEAESWEYQTKLRRNRIECGECGSPDILVTRTYTPDFFLDNGVIIEAKGRFTPEHRRIAQDFPEVKIIFMSDNFLRKGSKTRYSDWCEKNAIDYHVSYNGYVPDRWIND